MARFLEWQATRDPALALEALQDFRETINRGVTTANCYYVAARLCAAVLNDRLGDPKADPLYAEGATYLKLAVQHGYSRELLNNRPATMPCLAQWAATLPRDLKVEAPPNGTDENLRITDPVAD